MCGTLNLGYFCRTPRCGRFMERMTLNMVCEDALEIRKAQELSFGEDVSARGVDLNFYFPSAHGLCGTVNQSYGNIRLDFTLCRECISRVTQNPRLHANFMHFEHIRRLNNYHPARDYMVLLFNANPLMLWPVYDPSWPPSNRWAP